MYVSREVIVGDWKFARAFFTLMNENDILARFDFPRLDVADANARPLQITENRDRLLHLVGDATNHRDGFVVLLVSRVRKIEAGHVHARLDEPSQRRFIRAGRAKCANNFRPWYVRGGHFVDAASE